MNDEDWWRLVFDTQANRLYVEHEWAHADVRRGGPADNGTAEIEIPTFLSAGQGEAQRASFCAYLLGCLKAHAMPLVGASKKRAA